MLTAVLAALVGIVATARATRLITHDHYPPAEAFRRWWWNNTARKGGWREGWALLVSGDDLSGGCPFCLAPYAVAVDLTWCLLSGAWQAAPGWWAAAWWVVNVWAAVSYAAAMLVVRDEPAE